MRPLDGIHVVSLAINIPGPTVAMRLHELGAEVVKIEPPSGDPFALACRPYYEHLAHGQQIVTLDLKQAAGRLQLDRYLETADLLLTAQRASALDRLGLAWDALHARFPHLCHVAIVGYPPPDDEVAGHDLTFQAVCGLLDPPHVPKTLVADLGAAEQAVSAAVALLLARERGAEAAHAEVSIADAGRFFALPLEYRLTIDGPLSGRLPSYGIYRAADGYIALAALEPHFLRRLQQALGLARVTREDLEPIFATRPAAEWEGWAQREDIPLAALRNLPDTQ